MSPTTTLELELPTHALENQREPLQRTMMRHLLYDERITMSEALAILNREDQEWLVETIVHDAQNNLSSTAQLAGLELQEYYWQQYNKQLGYLFGWHEEWSPYHGQLLAMLRMVIRRYTPDKLTLRQFKLISTLTRRLEEEFLYQEDIFSATRALNDIGLDTLLNITDSDNLLLNSYIEELGRA